MARDLKSNAGDLQHHQKDFAGINQSAEKFNDGINTLSQKHKNEDKESDLRSLRSEFDYGSKKKFVDVLGNVNKNAHLNERRIQEQLERGENKIKGSIGDPS